MAHSNPEYLQLLQNLHGYLSLLGALFQSLACWYRLKISQRLGYFISMADIPTNVVEHIAQSLGISSILLSELKAYSLSGTCKRHHSRIRNYRNFRFFDISAKQLMLEAMSQSALTKDDPADLINIAIENLVRERYELPAFSTLAKAADHVYAKSYRDFYEKINGLLSLDERDLIDRLLRTSNESSYTPWHRIKQDTSSPTLTHLKELVSHHERISAQQVGSNALQEIPVAKIKQMAAEAKTLDAARMLEMEPNKRYSLVIALLVVQSTKVMDDIGEMLIKRMMSIQNKAKQSLDDYKIKSKESKNLRRVR